jgi:hypothetical protein
MTPETIKALVALLNACEHGVGPAQFNEFAALSNAVVSEGVVSWTTEHGYTVPNTEAPEAPEPPRCSDCRGHTTPIEHWPM